VTITCHAAVLCAPGQVLVRTAAGICGTDLCFAVGAFFYPTPTVLGHEASGTAAAAGAGVTTMAPGDRVIVCGQTFGGQYAARTRRAAALGSRASAELMRVDAGPELAPTHASAPGP
jgi:Zn-dependent alcohol dehydrogenase